MSTESSNSQMFPWLWGSSSSVTAEKTAGRDEQKVRKSPSQIHEPIHFICKWSFQKRRRCFVWFLRREVQLFFSFFCIFWGHKSHWWRLVVLWNHQQMAAVHQKPVLGFSRLARQHKREAPLMMLSQAGLDRWHSLSSLWFYPSEHLLPLYFRPDGGSGTTDNRVRARHPPPFFFFFSPHQHEIGVAPTPLLCIWFGAGQRQFAEAALDSAALLLERINIKTATGRGVRLHLTVRKEHKLLHHEQTSSCMLSQTLH